MKEAAEAIKGKEEHILMLWEETMKKEMPVAKKTERLLLLNILPNLIEDIAMLLDRAQDEIDLHNPPSLEEVVQEGMDHGRHRANIEHFNNQKIIKELSILHRVLIMFLKNKKVYNEEVGILLSLAIENFMAYYSQSEKVNIKTDNLAESNYLKMDDFYLSHYLYVDLFLRENLFPEASPEEVSLILKALKKYVSVENKLDVEFEKPGKKNYLIRFAILKKDDGTELLIAFTNWSTKKRLFEKEIKIENDSYTRWYFLNGNKMTYRKDMSNQNDYSNMTKSDLANAYLFDELSENDAEIKSTIDQILNQSDSNVSDKIMANLLLLKYQIFQQDNDNLIKQTDYLNKLFETNKSEPNLGGLEMAFDATKFQIELMK